MKDDFRPATWRCNGDGDKDGDGDNSNVQR